MIYKAIDQWYQIWNGSMPWLVLHTSCVNYSLESLQKLAALPLAWILPDNVRWELRLLCQSVKFGPKAAFLLKHARKDVPWDLEQLYRNCCCPVDLQALGMDTVVFAFGDQNKLDEFLDQAAPLTGRYVLLNRGWNCRKDDAVVYPLARIGARRCRRVQPLSIGRPAVPIGALSGVACPQSGELLCGMDFTPTGKSGAYAEICTSDRFPDKYVKLYTGCYVTGNDARKLRKLSTLPRVAGHLLLAWPEQLLTTENDSVVGYTMPVCTGRRLRDFVYGGWEENGMDAGALEQVLRNLFLLLLELHCLHIMVNDLSYNNVLVDDRCRVHLVDCDSFQVFDYPGGRITELYGHPQIDMERCGDTLRQPRHEYFALAVLLFQSLLYGNPLQRQVEDDRQLNWKDDSFPLDLRAEDCTRANGSIRAIWEGLDEKIKQIFADEFHFRSDNSLGAWIRALELLPHIERGI